MTDVIEAEVVETAPVKESFRPRLSSIQSRGKSSPYLTVKQRVLWFLDEHPGGSIDTEMLDHSAEHAIFKCTVRVPQRCDADDDYVGHVSLFTGHGSETRGDFADFIEKAETKAVGRALAHAGYGTEALDEGVPVDAAPPDRSSSPPAMSSGGASINQQKQIVDLQQLLGIEADVDLASLTAADAQAMIVRLRASLAKRG